MSILDDLCVYSVHCTHWQGMSTFADLCVYTGKGVGTVLLQAGRGLHTDWKGLRGIIGRGVLFGMPTGQTTHRHPIQGSQISGKRFC